MNEKLDVGTVFERIFQIYRGQFTLLIPAALVVFVPVAILSGLIYASDVSLFGVALLSVIGTIATYWFQGMVVEAVRDILDGRRDHTISSLLSSAAAVLGPLVLAGLLVAFATVIGFALLIVPGLIVLTFWAVVVPVIVIERVGVIDAFGRSIELVRGNGWQVFGVIVVLFLLEVIVNLILRAIALNAADTFAVYAVAALAVSLLIAPLRALAAAVLYFELKARRGEPVLGLGGGGQVEPGPAAPADPPTATQPAPPPQPPQPPPPPEAPPGP